MENNENPIQENVTNNVETNPQVNTQANTQQKKLNPYALASFICSLIGLVIFGLPMGIAAIVTGVNGNTSFDPETQSNKWMAIFGIVLGIIDVICVAFYMMTVYNSMI